jgi:hypothetical protein
MAGSPEVARGGEVLHMVPEPDRLKKIAHDMRSAIGAIQIWTHLMKEGHLGPGETVRAIETIEKSVAELAAQVRKLVP